MEMITQVRFLSFSETDVCETLCFLPTCEHSHGAALELHAPDFIFFICKLLGNWPAGFVLGASVQAQVKTKILYGERRRVGAREKAG